MKRAQILLVMLFAIMISCKGQAPAPAGGIEFFHGTWDEALAKAKAEKKLIFLDAYASWCAPCKMMAANVFTAKSVGDVFNPNFICVKMDMEKGEGVQLSQKLSVMAYPTLFFIDDTGKVLNKHVGGMQVESLIDLGKQMSEY